MLDPVALSYLSWLKQEDEKKRLENYRRYQDYYDGEHVIRLPERLKQALETDFGFVTNYCRRVVDIPVAFLSGADIGLEVAFSDELLREIDDEAQRKAAMEAQQHRADEAERFLYQVYRDSSLLRKNLIKALRIQGKKGELAFKVVLDGDKDSTGQLIRNGNLSIRIKVLRPDIVFPKWSPEDYEVMESCAIKYPRLNPQTNRPEIFAQVWWPDRVQEYVSTSARDLAWRLLREYPNPYGVIPVVWCKNREDDLPWGRSDLEDIIPLQDAVNKAMTDLMYNADLQAFQRIYLLGRQPNVRDNLQSGPGVVNSVADTNAKLQVVEPSSPEGLLAILKQLTEEISAISGVPQRLFNRGESGQLSGVALKIAFLSLIDLANEKAALMREALEWVNWIVFRIAAVEQLAPDYTDLETRVYLEEGLPADDRENTEVLTRQVDAGLKSRETAMKELGIEDVDAEIERIQAERKAAEDQFTLQALDEVAADEEEL